MRSWALRLAVFLLSLTIGWGASFAWNAQRAMSLCEIDISPEKYDGKMVRLRVIMSRDITIGGPVSTGAMISACSTCVGKDSWPDAKVDLDPQQSNLIPENRHFWRQDDEKTYVIEAILVGRFDDRDGMLHCFTSKYAISDARIERVIAIHEFRSGKELVEWMKSKSQ